MTAISSTSRAGRTIVTLLPMLAGGRTIAVTFNLPNGKTRIVTKVSATRHPKHPEELSVIGADLAAFALITSELERGREVKVDAGGFEYAAQLVDREIELRGLAAVAVPGDAW